MEAGIADHVWSLEELANMIDSNWPTTCALVPLTSSYPIL